MEKLKIFGKSHFEEDGTQNYLVFQPMLTYFKREKNTNYILEWKYKGICAEVIKLPITTDNILKPSLAIW